MQISKNVSATGLVISGPCKFHGIIVNSQSSGTLKIEDSVGGGQNLVIGTYALTGSPTWIMLPEPLDFKNGFYVTVGGTANVHFLFS